MIRIAFRGYNGKTLVFEEEHSINDFDLDEVLPKLAERHHAALKEKDLYMIEVEFLDEPLIAERFFRFGTDPAGMIVPIRIDLSGDGLSLVEKRIQDTARDKDTDVN